MPRRSLLARECAAQQRELSCRIMPRTPSRRPPVMSARVCVCVMSARVRVCVMSAWWRGYAHRRPGVRLAEFVPRPSDRVFALLSFGAAAAVTPLPIGAADVRPAPARVRRTAATVDFGSAAQCAR